MFERFTDPARQVLTLAQNESSQLGHGFIGTEHILLGLIQEKNSKAAQVLTELGVTYEKSLEVVKETIGEGHTPPSGWPYTPRAKKVLELGLREALQLGHSWVGPEHLLLGLVREGEGVAATVLVTQGADLRRIAFETRRKVDEASDSAIVTLRISRGQLVKFQEWLIGESIASPDHPIYPIAVATDKALAV